MVSAKRHRRPVRIGFERPDDDTYGASDACIGRFQGRHFVGKHHGPIGEAFFRSHPERRVQLFALGSDASLLGPGVEYWYAGIRSLHTYSFNIAHAWFFTGARTWAEPETDDEALAIVADFDLNTALQLARLTFDARELTGKLHGFDKVVLRYRKRQS